MKRTLIAGTALALAAVGGLHSPAKADSSCSVSGSGPVTAGAYSGGAQVCLTTGPVKGTVTATPSYVVADGAPTNPEPADGYIGVDGSGPVGCASGEYAPGGSNNRIVNPSNPVPSGACTPQPGF